MESHPACQRSSSMNEFKQDHTPWKRFLKRSFYFLHRYYLHFKKSRPKQILFHPQLPGWKTGIHNILINLEISITDNPSAPFTLAIFWEDRTFRRRRKKLDILQDTKKVINYHCTDISKEKVEEVFKQVFGYDLYVDPHATNNRILRKSNFNGRHDGKVIQGPVSERKKDFVYEKVLNNQINDNLFQDLRITYFNGIIPLVSPRFHNKANRFGNTTKATIEKVENHLTREELKLIRCFCTRLGLEYGDLDLIRNKNDQRLYVVDANPTPTIPPPSVMKPALRKIMIQKWSEAFKEAFLND